MFKYFFLACFFSFDVRDNMAIEQPRHWSAPEVFGSRAKFHFDSQPATLEIKVSSQMVTQPFDHQPIYPSVCSRETSFIFTALNCIKYLNIPLNLSKPAKTREIMFVFKESNRSYFECNMSLHKATLPFPTRY